MKEPINPVKSLYRNARWEVARLWYRLHPGVDTIGITGSVGKTTTKEAIAEILSTAFPTLRTAENFDPIFNIPLTALKIRDSEKFVLEMGVDGAGQMEKYLSLIIPRIGVVTRFTLAHSDEDHFGSLGGLIREKSHLITSLPEYGWAVLNGDDPNVKKLKQKTKASVLLFGYGYGNNLHLKNYVQNFVAGSVFSSFDIEYGFEKFEVRTRLLGKQNSMCITAAIAVGMIMGLSSKDILDAVWKIEPVPQRLNIKHSVWGGILIDDTYNASPEAVKAAIDVLAYFDLNDKTLVLGQMKELGKFSKKSHYEVGKYARKNGVSELLVMGDDSDEVINGFGGGQSFQSHNVIAEELLKRKPKVVLVKGSRGMMMEKLVEKLALNS